MSHVLYQGVKGYLLTENVVARKLPGASTLVKFGQKTMSAAAPNLEAGVDRRLTAFVEANLSETLRESRRYLEATPTPELLTEMADEVWTTLADRPVGEIIGVADPEGTREVVVAVGRSVTTNTSQGEQPGQVGMATRNGPDEVVIEVAASAVNRADLMQSQGLYPPPPGAPASRWPTGT
mgnify:CR=1 FL=1